MMQNYVNSMSASVKDFGVLVIVGLILLHLSQSLTPFGDFYRLGSLFGGFSLIIYAAIRRVNPYRQRVSGFVLASGFYCVFLGFLSFVQDHEMWQEPVQIVFFCVCVILFWAGYVLGRRRSLATEIPKSWLLYGVYILSAVALLKMLYFVQSVFGESYRGYGETSLNAVGIAYVHMCLILIFMVLAAYSNAAWQKLVLSVLGLLAFFVVVSSLSRGPILWGGVSIISFFLFIKEKVKIRVNRVVITSVVVALVVCLGVYLLTLYDVFAYRFDSLVWRFESMFDYFLSGASDKSMEARFDYSHDYFSTISEWWLIGQYGFSHYPHNQWLEIVTRFGIFGLPMLAMSLFVFVRVGLDILRKRVPHTLELSLITVLFLFAYLQSMSSLNLLMNRVLWLGFGYFLGMYSHRSEEDMRRKNSTVSPDYS